MEELYSISEMAHMFNVSRQTLIYYDKIGLFKPAQVNVKGYRLYSPTQIPYLRLICMLSGIGLSLEKISHLMRHADMDAVTELLRGRIEALDEQISDLQGERTEAVERLEFYDAARFWLAHEGEPMLKEFPERYVVVEPFVPGAPVDRATLHPTLMRAIAHMKAQVGGSVMRGWGTVLQQDALRGPDPLLGAGSFVVVAGPTGFGASAVSESPGGCRDDAGSGGLAGSDAGAVPGSVCLAAPAGADVAFAAPVGQADRVESPGSALAGSAAAGVHPSVVEVVPAGVYLCLSRWGMPFNLAGLSRLMACMEEHELRPCGNAYDFCYLDTTSYDDKHQEDFCCIQVPVDL